MAIKNISDEIRAKYELYKPLDFSPKAVDNFDKYYRAFVSAIVDDVSGPDGIAEVRRFPCFMDNDDYGVFSFRFNLVNVGDDNIHISMVSEDESLDFSLREAYVKNEGDNLSSWLYDFTDNGKAKVLSDDRSSETTLSELLKSIKSPEHDFVL